MALTFSKMVPLGLSAPDFNLKGIDDCFHSLSSYDCAKVLVIIFMCNHCPYVQKIWPALISLKKELPAEVEFIGINSNANPAYTEDSFEKMKEYAAERGQNFPYLFDEDQKTAKAYNAVCTPDIFVFDRGRGGSNSGSRTLKYRGAFEGLKSAVTALLKGEEPPEDQTHSMGCSIKWTA